jgi:uncharacterized protein (TIGR00255 family)
MIKSMTGFGKSIAEIPQKKISIEIKSLNSKSLDLNTRLPWIYKEKESEIRNLVSQKLDRGKIDLAINFDVLDAEIVPVINKNVIKNYFTQMKEISSEMGINSDEQILSIIMRLPDALKTEKPELAEDEWIIVREKISEAIEQLDGYRSDEGKSLEADLIRCIGKILGFLQEVEHFEVERTNKIREKLNSSLIENVGKQNVDMNRDRKSVV